MKQRIQMKQIKKDNKKRIKRAYLSLIKNKIQKNPFPLTCSLSTIEAKIQIKQTSLAINLY